MIQQIPFTLLDVGASGGIQERWRTYTGLQFYGFEPDSRGSSDVVKKGRETWINCGVAEAEGKFKFNLIRAQCNSSLLKPNLKVIERLAYDVRDFDVVEEAEITCDTLDNICQKFRIKPDFIKLDTQGTEFGILQGGIKTIPTVFGFEIEVEFLPLYEKQKLFADVDSFMRSHGFILMDLGNQLYMKGRRSQHLKLRKGFLVAADALYFQSVESFVARVDNLNAEEILSVLPICKAYGYLNYAYELFSELKVQKPELYSELSKSSDVLSLIESESPRPSIVKLSERKYSKIRAFLEKRIKNKTANWNYGLGNPEI